ncbi:arabinan endo-1,5-alpha-L-arabinosidase [Fibrella aestuarina BUZ 2]|uniref:Arabinan endo-1,5-alpha-L-arabinosidase n=1 Tax=Fibrella aestuarina BUZ 2 TaxID=1166018 RepID=I0KEX6_9BACT|nr:arabinan endo-1,5-alpha-L-arabinosidase [Fibrella aestuarina]CCH02679.1 arabinan endo-1,5-alpha-L-arabinosidase [Fibrella aestuarina BUZ 2]
MRIRFGPWIGLLALLCGVAARAQDPDIVTHDPSTVLNEAGTYWYFATGNGIQVVSSPDRKRWTPQKPIFEKGTWPNWIDSTVRGFKGHFWAPDCIRMNGRYFLYYSCSTFGSPVSAIGVATSPTLNPQSPDYRWTDQGMVVSSKVRTDINAIDPSLLRDTDGRVYLAYGSFHGGLGAAEIDTLTGKLKAGATIKTVAGGRQSDWEAAALIREGNYYYLFANNGLCCKGLNSTYYIVVGRSTSPLGPFVDQSGRDLTAGGGTLVLRTDGRYIGPGHVGLLRDGNRQLVSIHFYDADDKGKARLAFRQLTFRNGWPVLAPE